MSRKWVGKKKTLNFSEQELELLKKICAREGRTETDVIRAALRRYAASNEISAP